MSNHSIPNCKSSNLQTLEKQVKNLFSKKKAATVEICLLSSGIRDKYLVSVDEGRATYDAEFNNWIKYGSGAAQYGGVENFTKYAGAGDAINYFSSVKKPKKDNFDYVNALPLNSVSALNEVNKIINCLEGFVDHRKEPRIFTLFHGWVQRTSEDDKVGEETTKIGKLIHPQSTASDLKSWREHWVSPEGKVIKPSWDGIKFTEIRINSSLFEWNQAGNKSEDQICFDDFTKELARLKKVLIAEGFTSNENRNGILAIDISDEHIDAIKSAYESKEQKMLEKIEAQREAALGIGALKKKKYKESE